MLSQTAIEKLREKVQNAGKSVPTDYNTNIKRSSTFAVDIEFFHGLCVYAKVRVNVKTNKISFI